MTIARRRRIVGFMLATVTAGAGVVVASGVYAMRHTLKDVFKEIDDALAGQ
jgi:hypothetical protein